MGFRVYCVEDDHYDEAEPEGQSDAVYFASKKSALKHAQLRAAALPFDNTVSVKSVVLARLTPLRLVLAILNGRGYVRSREEIARMRGGAT